MALELRGREEPARRVPSGAVEEDFDVLEDLGPQLGLRGPGAAADEFLLDRREELSARALMPYVKAAGGRLRVLRRLAQVTQALAHNRALGDRPRVRGDPVHEQAG